MNKNIRVEVTQADIDEGARNSGIKCMVALAIERLVGAAVTQLLVAPRHAEIVEDGVRLYYEFTDTTIKRIRDFDNGKVVKPFVTIIRGV